MSDSWGCIVLAQDEKEDLGNVVEALEVVEFWVRAQDLDYYV